MAEFFKEIREKLNKFFSSHFPTFWEGYDAMDFAIDRFYYILTYPFVKIARTIKYHSLIKQRDLEDKNPEKALARIERREKLIDKLKRIGRKILTIDEQIAGGIIHFVNRFDRKSDELAEKAEEAAKAGGHRFSLAAEWAELNKTKLLTQLAVVVFAAFMVVSIFNFCTGYEYSYNGRKLGYVNDQEDVLRISTIVAERLSVEHSAEISIDPEKDITFRKVFILGKNLDDQEDVLTRMTYMQEIIAKGVGIYVDGQRVAIVDSEDTAHKVLNNVLSRYTVESDRTTYEEIGFAEDITFQEIDTKLGRLENLDEVVTKLLTGKSKIDYYFVEAGDTVSGIAKKLGLTTQDLKALNPVLANNALTIGQQLTVSTSSPLVTVQTVETSTLTEYIPFETTYQEDSSVYVGENVTKVAGEKGERTVTARIVKNNGVEVARLELNSEITKDPVTEVIIKGTKPLPPKQGSGTYIYPVTNGRLSSGFGARWGRHHNGIDLACPQGSTVRASDGGTVIYSGYSGSYGYLVKIDHGGGYVTLYAHNSKLLVSVGDRVYQGQKIALSGNTGNSTGPHCHFEVQYFGTPKNPMNYL